MPAPIRDTAQVRLDNAMRLFDEFVAAAVKNPDATALRGLERRFAERLQIQPSYWSQIKGRSRQIGERLARQFEQLFHKPQGWMDHDHDDEAPAAVASPSTSPAVAQDDDERFIMGLVLTFYRRHPQRARARLLDLLGEVLTPESAAGAASSAPATRAAKPAPVVVNEMDDWRKLQQGIAPLKPKKR